MPAFRALPIQEQTVSTVGKRPDAAETRDLRLGRRRRLVLFVEPLQEILVEGVGRFGRDTGTII
jgi:hypothetical protein